MDNPGKPGRVAHIFSLRLWQEAVDGGHHEWRGRVEHLSSGEFFYFRDGSPIVPLLVRLLPGGAGQESAPSVKEQAELDEE
ncbi:MAG: hypothetical protein R3335_02610 [Anaerolineales bacterium]|nr:hypothetical protein [Anaerolineales bacterium]